MTVAPLPGDGRESWQQDLTLPRPWDQERPPLDLSMQNVGGFGRGFGRGFGKNLVGLTSHFMARPSRNDYVLVQSLMRDAVESANQFKIGVEMQTPFPHDKPTNLHYPTSKQPWQKRRR